MSRKSIKHRKRKEEKELRGLCCLVDAWPASASDAGLFMAEEDVQHWPQASVPIGKVSSLVTCHSKRECSISQAAGAGRILVLHYSSQYSAQHTNGREIVFCSGAPHALTMRYRFEDFAECFPTYVEEDRNGASATFNSIADYIEAQNFVRSVHIYFNASQA